MIFHLLLLTTSLGLAQAHRNYPYKPNLLLEVSNIHHNQSHVIVNYKAVACDNPSRLPFHLENVLTVSFQDHIVNGTRNTRYIHHFKTATNEWQRQSGRLTRFNKKTQPITQLGFSAGEQVNFGDILKDIFGCLNPMEKFVSRIFFVNFKKHHEAVSVHVTSSRRIGIPKFVELFWTIGKSDSISMDNDENFEEFMDECLSFPLNNLLLGMLFGGSVVVAIGIYGYELTVFVITSVGSYRHRNRVANSRRIAWG
jgi:hypothetical protein